MKKSLKKGILVQPFLEEHIKQKKKEGWQLMGKVHTKLGGWRQVYMWKKDDEK